MKCNQGNAVRCGRVGMNCMEHWLHIPIYMYLLYAYDTDDLYPTDFFPG